MTSTLPKLRSDLDRRVQITPSGSVLLIKDPVSGEFFRLREAERFIAEQLDGFTPLNVLKSRVRRNSAHPSRRRSWPPSLRLWIGTVCWRPKPTDTGLSHKSPDGFQGAC